MTGWEVVGGAFLSLRCGVVRGYSSFSSSAAFGGGFLAMPLVGGFWFFLWLFSRCLASAVASLPANAALPVCCLPAGGGVLFLCLLRGFNALCYCALCLSVL